MWCKFNDQNIKKCPPLVTVAKRLHRRAYNCIWQALISRVRAEEACSNLVIFKIILPSRISKIYHIIVSIDEFRSSCRLILQFVLENTRNCQQYNYRHKEIILNVSQIEVEIISWKMFKVNYYVLSDYVNVFFALS